MNKGLLPAHFDHIAQQQQQQQQRNAHPKTNVIIIIPAANSRLSHSINRYPKPTTKTTTKTTRSDVGARRSCRTTCVKTSFSILKGDWHFCALEAGAATAAVGCV